MVVRKKRTVRESSKGPPMGHKPKYELKEFTRRGDSIYKDRIEPTLSPKDKGKYVAIDIETGEYEISRDSMKATMKLYDRIPNAQPWMVRVGYAFVVKFGRHVRASKP